MTARSEQEWEKLFVAVAGRIFNKQLACIKPMPIHVLVSLRERLGRKFSTLKPSTTLVFVPVTGRGRQSEEL